MRSRRLLTLLAVPLLLACSGPTPSGGPTPSAAPASVPPPASSTAPSASPSTAIGAIRTKPGPAVPDEICSGVGVDAVLHGDAADARVAWLINRLGGKPYNIVWPFGYTARFAPNLEILDAQGKVVAQEGTRVTGVCDLMQDGSAYLVPPFK